MKTIYRVEHYDRRHGKKQVIFKRKKYRRKRSLQLNEVKK